MAEGASFGFASSCNDTAPANANPDAAITMANTKSSTKRRPGYNLNRLDISTIIAECVKNQ